MRDFWRGEPATLAEFASRVSGSADLYQDDGRRPFHSINFVTCHDGVTLTDLVSYDDKHNEANGEDNRDGESHNRSRNCGVEGPTDDEGVLALRARQRRNFLRRRFFTGLPVGGRTAEQPLPDLAWYTPDGREINGGDWRGHPVRQRRGHPGTRPVRPAPPRRLLPPGSSTTSPTGVSPTSTARRC